MCLLLAGNKTQAAAVSASVPGLQAGGELGHDVRR
jgi:hypothetical protein